MLSKRYFCQSLIKPDLLETFSKKPLISVFFKILLVGAEILNGAGQTVGLTKHDKTNNPFSQFCERA
jgi:hypothetical protein